MRDPNNRETRRPKDGSHAVPAGQADGTLVPGGDVVSRGDGDAPPPGLVPAAVRVPGEDALAASVAIATTIGQRQLLDLHRRADVQVSLGEDAISFTVTTVGEKTITLKRCPLNSC